jgi:hypothetical protein
MQERMTRLEEKLQKTDTELQTTNAKLQKTDTELQTTNAELQMTNARVTDLQNRVKVLTLTSEGYRKIRHRFLEVYHRDIRNDVDGQGRKKIHQGNEATHHGDAVTDASLYTSHERHDEMVMVELYGLTANQISFLGEHQTSTSQVYVVVSLCSITGAGDIDSISTLNAGATWRAKGPSNIPLDVDTAFKTFAEELNENLGKSPTDGATSLSKAYYAFWKVHKKYKQ